MLIQIKYKDLPLIKEQLMAQQTYKCPICKVDLLSLQKRDRCVDHEHFGEKRIRAVLCRRCNVLEGKLYNSYQRSTPRLRKSHEDYINVIKGLAKYPKLKPTKYIHPLAVRKKRKKKVR